MTSWFNLRFKDRREAVFFLSDGWGVAARKWIGHFVYRVLGYSREWFSAELGKGCGKRYLVSNLLIIKDISNDCATVSYTAG